MIDVIDKFGTMHPADSVVFREGDVGSEMYIIHSGEIKISKKAKSAEQVLAVLSDGDFFGEMALFTNQERSATATCARKSQILKIDKDSIEFMIENQASFAINLIKTLCERLKKTDDRIEEILVLSKETRVMKAMETYWRSNGHKDSTGEKLLIPFHGFLDYARKNLGISPDDTKAILYIFKQKDLVHVRKDVNEQIYLSFSPKIFSFLEAS